MTAVNVFRGSRTGELQTNFVEDGLNPEILIPGEDFLEWIETREI